MAHLYHTISFRQNQHNFVQLCPHSSKFVQPALAMLYPQAGSHFRQKVIRLAQNSFLHIAHRRARCLLIRTIGEIGQCRQCIALIIIFRHKPLFLLQQCSHNCFMQLDCPQMRSNLLSSAASIFSSLLTAHYAHFARGKRKNLPVQRIVVLQGECFP